MAKVKEIRSAGKADEERQAITGMVIDAAFLRQIQPITDLEYFRLPYARTVAGWCLEYFEQYQEAPGRQIEDIFKAKNRTGAIDEQDSKLISRFLESISDEYERGEKRSTEYLARCTERFFRLRALRALREDIALHEASGNVEAAEEALARHKSPQRGGINHVNPFTDEAGLLEAFTKSVEPLFRLPGVLGEAWNGQLLRDSFIGVMGPEKRGKTWALMYLSLMAARSSCNVVFFAIGDMTKPQMELRFAIMNTGRSNRAKYCREKLVPRLDCHWNQIGECNRKERLGSGDLLKDLKPKEKPQLKSYDEEPDWIPCTKCRRADQEERQNWKGAAWMRMKLATEPLTFQGAVKAGKEFNKRVLAGKSFRLECYSRGAINVKGMRAVLSTWEANDGFVPDVVVIDYADNLGPEDGCKEFRHQQNESWGAMRALSQDFNCLVITATQADAASYNVETLNESNFSEDKRKYSHVTAIATLNQKPEEKRRGLLRVGQMFLREDDFDSAATVTLLQDLSSGQPVLASFR